MKGVLIHEDSALRNMIAEARQRGYRLEIHAIGDAAADQV
jgi:predicted amidohydrolase YtcJ